MRSGAGAGAGTRAIQRHDVDRRGAGRPQAVGQRVARLLGPGDQHPAPASPAGERVQQPLGHGALGDDVRQDADRADRRRRAGPDRRHLAPASARASPPTRSSSRRGAFGRVDADEVVARARRWAAPASGSMRITGALDRRRRPGRAGGARGRDACARARVTATVTPCSGRRSAQAMPSRSAGDRADHRDCGRAHARRPTSAAMVASVPVTRRWRGVVPDAITARGRVGGRPPAISRAAIVTQAADAHQDHERAAGARQRLPVDVVAALASDPRAP